MKPVCKIFKEEKHTFGNNFLKEKLYYFVTYSRVCETWPPPNQNSGFGPAYCILHILSRSSYLYLFCLCKI